MRYLLPICLLIASPSWAQDVGNIDVLTKAEEEAREKAAQLASESQSVRADIAKLKSKLSVTARETQAVEQELLSLEQQTAELTESAVNLRAQIASDRENYSDLLAALQRLEASPPPTIALSPRDAKTAAQAGQLMASLSAQLKDRAEALSLNLTALDVTQSQIARKQIDLEVTRNQLKSQMKSVSAGLSDKGRLEARIADERGAANAEAQRLAAESKNLIDLIAKLEAEASTVKPLPKPGSTSRPSAPVTVPKGTTRFAQAKGKMLRPVAGRVLRKFGKGEKGMTFAGRASGQVLAPYTGRVEFSGPFKNYDQVVILNVGDGYFVLLTGLNALFIGAGDDVRRGEPVGTLPAKSNAELYIELRRNGATLDPAPWLEASDVKSG